VWAAAAWSAVVAGFHFSLPSHLGVGAELVPNSPEQLPHHGAPARTVITLNPLFFGVKSPVDGPWWGLGLNGIQEVVGSTPISSTNKIKAFFAVRAVAIEFGANFWCKEIPVQ
jgi:hypothetical protein